MSVVLAGDLHYSSRVSHPVSSVRGMVNRSHLSIVPDTAGRPDMIVTIDCGVCVARYTTACDDCVVTHVVGHEIGQPVEFEVGDALAIQLLADAGLVPGSKFEREQPVA